LTVVIDASAMLFLLAQENGQAAIARLKPHAPVLMWSESTSTIRERWWRGDYDAPVAAALLAAVLEARVERHHSDELYRGATDVAIQLGWIKVYDAQYVALAKMLDAPLVTVDHRLRRGVSRVITVLTPDEALA
jgi:predicted nucleic acid-binding protein